MRRRLATWVVLLGGSAAALAPSAAQDVAQAPTPEGTLQVLTYNVHGLPQVITGDETLARQVAISPLLEPFQVVGLQEDFTDAGHQRLLARAPHPTRERFDAALPARIYGSGLTLLAMPPAVRVQSEHYLTYHGVLEAGSDGLASKGFQMVRLQLAPGVELDVYNTHMDAGGSQGDQEARAVQAAHLLSAMNGVSAGRAILLLGDTNLKPGQRGRDRETLARWLEGAGLACACLASRDACCARIDRILVRSGVGLELTVTSWDVAPGFQDAEGRGLSDHEPLQASIRWRRRPI